MVKTEFSLVRWKGNQELADKTYEGVDYLTSEDLAEGLKAYLPAKSLQLSGGM